MSTYTSDIHENQCENAEYYYCKDCKELVPDSECNQCPVCLVFIPRVAECICDMLPKLEPVSAGG